MSKHIFPTVGRVVHFIPPFVHGAKQPDALPALISYVQTDSGSHINIGGFDADGNHFARTNVQLVQDGDELPAGGGYACWMEYQKVQAEKNYNSDLNEKERRQIEQAGNRLDLPRANGTGQATAGTAGTVLAKDTAQGPSDPKQRADRRATALNTPDSPSTDEDRNRAQGQVAQGSRATTGASEVSTKPTGDSGKLSSVDDQARAQAEAKGAPKSK